jgi:hypothetical protein
MKLYAYPDYNQHATIEMLGVFQTLLLKSFGVIEFVTTPPAGRVIHRKVNAGLPSFENVLCSPQVVKCILHMLPGGLDTAPRLGESTRERLIPRPGCPHVWATV